MVRAIKSIRERPRLRVHLSARAQPTRLGRYRSAIPKPTIPQVLAFVPGGLINHSRRPKEEGDLVGEDHDVGNSVQRFYQVAQDVPWSPDELVARRLNSSLNAD